MQFYCPVCLSIVETEPTNTIITKFNRIGYKAHCPVCGQDLACYPNEAAKEPVKETAVGETTT